jgi:biopolymer transport protein ExbB/TolQ
MLDIVLNYLDKSSSITILILVSLSIYFVLSIWIFMFKSLQLNSDINEEKNTLDSLMIGESSLSPTSGIGRCIKHNTSLSKEILNTCEISLIRDASTGLSWLSIVSSTAPFIGLFGTVVGILESFSAFAGSGKVSFSVIAPAISEALVATAAGIFVAIFAYTFHQFLVRKVYILNTYITSQINIIISRK